MEDAVIGLKLNSLYIPLEICMLPMHEDKF